MKKLSPVMAIKSTLLSFSLTLVSQSLSAEPSVIFEEERYKTVAGESLEVKLLVKDFDKLDAGGVSIKFDPSQLQIKGISLDTSVWRFVNRDGDVDNTTGLIRDIGFSNFQSVSGPDAVIGTITFDTIAPGRSTLELSESIISPFAVDGQAIAASYSKAIINLSGKNKNK